MRRDLESGCFPTFATVLKGGDLHDGEHIAKYNARNLLVNGPFFTCCCGLNETSKRAINMTVTWQSLWSLVVYLTISLIAAGTCNLYYKNETVQGFMFGGSEEFYNTTTQVTFKNRYLVTEDWSVIPTDELPFVNGVFNPFHDRKKKLPRIGMFKTMEFIEEKLNNFVPFIFGLYISLCVGRWWTLRTQGVGSVADACLQMVRFLTTFCTVGADGRCIDTADEISSIYKLALTSMRLTYNGGNEVQKTERVWRLLQNDSEGLNAEEKQMLKEVCNASEQAKENLEPALDLAQLLWLLISHRGRKLMAMASVAGPQQNLFFQIITKACDGLGLQDSHENSQLPFPYVFMIFAMVQINNIVQVWVAGSRLAMHYILSDYGSIITELLYIIFVPAFYNSLLQICVGLEDPMGKDDFDIPLDKGIIQPTSDLCKKMVEVAHRAKAPRRHQPCTPPPHSPLHSPSSSSTQSTNRGGENKETL
eukprot:TRINITY_DN1555_c0_g1_i2.p1 TRINITY_DN1555_c0_g1~~TRINITY_DN1555_c0_g1_i2.p1  ORF type:complete len:496 (-),score=76.71 TRINITY_DN1555_c0_g1_i2:254-1684(-)